MTLQKVTLVGGTGTLGVPLVAALRKNFELQVITRNSSRKTVPEGVKAAQVSDDYTVNELETIFEGQYAVICAVPAFASSVQVNIIEAARKAGVKRYLPGEFGLDTTNKTLVEAMPGIQNKASVLQSLQNGAEEDPNGLSYTAIVTGLFFDWAILTNFLPYDIEKQHAQIVGDGDERFSATSVEDIVLAVVRVLQREVETRNKVLFVQSLSTTQNDVVASLESATGAKWTVDKFERQSFMASAADRANKGDFSGIKDQVVAFGVLESYFEQRPEFANDLLGLSSRNLNDEVKRIVAEATVR